MSNKMKNYLKCSDHDIFFIMKSYRFELIELQKLIDVNKENIWNRVFVRTLITLIEGVSYRTRQNLINKVELGELNLLPEELIILKEKSIELSKDGTLREKDKYFPFEQMFRFTFNAYARSNDKLDLFTKELSDHGFRALKEAVIIRNRTTHPKNAKDIYVNGKEVEQALIAYEWFLSLQLKCLMETYSMNGNKNKTSPFPWSVTHRPPTAVNY